MFPQAMQLRDAYIVCVFVHHALYRPLPLLPLCITGAVRNCQKYELHLHLLLLLLLLVLTELTLTLYTLHKR
jgi:hypothetical protein